MLNFFDIIYLALAMPFALIVAKSPRMRKIFLSGLGERTGHPRAVRPKGKVAWVHAASVGEVRLAMPLVKRLQARGFGVMVSAFTDTGREAAAKLMPPGCVFFAPFDLSPFVRRTFDRVRPDMLVIMESELWPNMLTEARRRRVPAFLINARLTEKSLSFYRRFSGTYRTLFGAFTAIAARDASVGAMITSLGVPQSKVTVTGNMKYDMTDSSDVDPVDGARLFGKEAGELFVAAGSTHAPEERMVLEAFAKMRKAHPRTRLIIAPRHVERSAEVASICREFGHETALFYSLRPGEGKRPDCFVLDSIGNLLLTYSVADIILVGGSFGVRGGQNPLEPAFLSKPVIFGRNMSNFREPSELLIKCGAATVVADAGELADAFIKLAGSAEMRAECGRKAKEAVESMKGVADANLNLIFNSLSQF